MATVTYRCQTYPQLDLIFAKFVDGRFTTDNPSIQAKMEDRERNPLFGSLIIKGDGVVKAKTVKPPNPPQSNQKGTSAEPQKSSPPEPTGTPGGKPAAGVDVEKIRELATKAMNNQTPKAEVPSPSALKAMPKRQQLDVAADLKIPDIDPSMTKTEIFDRIMDFIQSKEPNP